MPTHIHTTTIVTDLTFGDAGKGSVTDALARRQKASLVVRYNGGAQAAHTVVEASGRTHTFRQYGSGTFADGCETFLSRFVLVNPIALLDETLALRSLGVADAPARLHIDARAPVTTPYHMILNQLREIARGVNRHGSCGLGIGETVADALAGEQNGEPEQTLRFGDLTAGDALLKGKLRAHRILKQWQADELLPSLRAQSMASNSDASVINVLLDQLDSDDELDATVEVFAHVAAGVHVASPDFLVARLRRPDTATLFEGAQGVLLDEDWGFHPHTTWSHTTPANALRLIAETGVGDVQSTVLGLTRAYATRHGAGPFPTESAAVTAALPEPHNPTNDWQGPFRAGPLDLALLRYAVAASGHIDGLVMTCLDRLPDLPTAEAKVGIGYAHCHTGGDAPWHLVAQHPGCLERREADGKTLGEVAVRYAPAPRDATAYAAWVAEQLGLPLLGTSAGPMARDKWFAF